MTKYIYGAVIISLVLVGFWVNNLVDTVIEQKAKIEKQEAEIATAELTIKQSSEAVVESNQDSVKHQQATEAVNNEDQNLKRDLASNVRVVYIKASCPSLPATATTTSGTGDTTCRLDAAAEQDYATLVAAIARNKLMYERLQADNRLIRKLCGGEK